MCIAHILVPPVVRGCTRLWDTVEESHTSGLRESGANTSSVLVLTARENKQELEAPWNFKRLWKKDEKGVEGEGGRHTERIYSTLAMNDSYQPRIFWPPYDISRDAVD